MNVLIVEDEPLLASNLAIIVEDLGHHPFPPATNAEDALQQALDLPPDLLLMDVNIAGEFDGIETAEKILKNHSCPVIFITAQTDELTFRRASRLGPANFLLKPFEEIQVKRAIQLASTSSTTKAPQPANEGEEDNLYVRTGHKLQKIPMVKVTHVAADGRYCEIHTTSGRYLTRMPLSEMQNRLPTDQFIKCHRSYLVNESFVDSVDLRDSEIVLTTGGRVPLAKREREAFLKRID